jgi:hypothetical protein
MEQGWEALKKLNVFPRKAVQPGKAMFSKARLDTLSDGILALAMTLLILDVRLPDDFHPLTAANCWRQIGVWGIDLSRRQRI